MGKLEISYIGVDQLTPYEHNTRQHNDEDIEQIEKSIRKYGFRDPVGVWGKNNIIVEGHGRVMAAKKIGLKEIPVIRLDDMTDDERREYAVLHNWTAEQSEWNFDELKAEMENLDFDGFNLEFNFDEEIGETENPDDSEDVEDDGEIMDEPDEPKCKKGQIWQLGRHRLMCGDSTDSELVSRLMDGETADIAFCSPPYGVVDGTIRGHKVAGGDNRHLKKNFYNEYNDDMTGWASLIEKTYQNMKQNSRMQFINIQMLTDNKTELCKFIGKHAENIVDIIVWLKKIAPPQMAANVLNNLYEFIFVFAESGHSRKLDFGTFHGNVQNVITVDKEQNQYADVHKAVFPVALPIEILKINGKAESCIDLFGGTGTTMIACENLGRKCYMMELDPKYCDIIINRWETLTGEKAVLLNE